MSGYLTAETFSEWIFRLFQDAEKIKNELCFPIPEKVAFSLQTGPSLDTIIQIIRPEFYDQANDNVLEGEENLLILKEYLNIFESEYTFFKKFKNDHKDDYLIHADIKISHYDKNYHDSMYANFLSHIRNVNVDFEIKVQFDMM